MEFIRERKIFILKGKESTGKTETLIRLCYILFGLADSTVIQKYNKWTSDRHGLFEFRNTKISVGTAGDNMEEIEENLSFFQKNKPSIIFTALKSNSKRKSKMESIIEQFAINKKYSIETILKSKKKTNAQEAFDLLNKIIF